MQEISQICIQHQFGRPIAGTINICPNFVENNRNENDIDSIIHDLTYISHESSFVC